MRLPYLLYCTFLLWMTEAADEEDVVVSSVQYLNTLAWEIAWSPSAPTSSLQKSITYQVRYCVDSLAGCKVTPSKMKRSVLLTDLHAGIKYYIYIETSGKWPSRSFNLDSSHYDDCVSIQYDCFGNGSSPYETCYEKSRKPSPRCYVAKNNIYVSPVRYLHTHAWQIHWSEPSINYIYSDTSFNYISYNVTYCHSVLSHCIETLPLSATSIMLTKLSTDVRYEVFVTASSERGSTSWKMRQFGFDTLRNIECRSIKYSCWNTRGNIQACIESNRSPSYGCLTQLAPPMISTLHIIRTSSSTIRVQWASVDDDRHQITSYSLKYDSKPTTRVSFLPKFRIYTYLVTNLQPNTTYNFMVEADNLHGSSSSNIVQGKTTAGIQYHQAIIPSAVKITPLAYSESSTLVVKWNNYMLQRLSNTPVNVTIEFCNNIGCAISTMTQNGYTTINRLQPNTSYDVTFNIYDLKGTTGLLWKKRAPPIVTSTRDACREFSCASVAQCISYTNLCDGNKDCEDGSDESSLSAKCTTPPTIDSLQVYKTSEQFISMRLKPFQVFQVSKISAYQVMLNSSEIIKVQTITMQHNVTFNPQYLVFTFENLTKHINYEARVKSMNPFGWSNWSKPVLARTTSNIGITGPVSGDIIITPLIHGLSPIWRIKWKPPTFLSNNAVQNLTYSVHYCEIISLRKISCSDTSRNHNTYVDLLLRRNTFYQYNIIVYNSYNIASKEKVKGNFLAQVSQFHDVTCLNQYLQNLDFSKKLIGIYPKISLDLTTYKHNSRVLFKCPRYFYFDNAVGLNAHSATWIRCTKTGQWSDPWPLCRGNLENITCLNEYQTTHITRHSWQNPTPNRIHATYEPILPEYPYGDQLTFNCPIGYSLVRSKGLRVMRVKCQVDSTFSSEWPMCKGQTCDRLSVRAGFVSLQDTKRYVGLEVEITCLSGYYLWGSNKSVCMDNLMWSGTHLRECYDLPSYQRNCKDNHGVMMFSFQSSHKKIPYCHYEVKKSGDSSQTTHLAIGTSIPMSIAFIVTIIAAIFYVRHKRLQMARRRELAASYYNRETVHLVLPSYEQSEKDKPTTPPPTFDETFQYAHNPLNPPMINTEDAEETNALLQPMAENSDTSTNVNHLPPAYTRNDQNNSMNGHDDVNTEVEC